MNSKDMPEQPFMHELNLYNASKKKWLQNHPNEFVVIAGDQIAGFYADYAAAFQAAIRAFGIEGQFLIKQVCAAEPVYVVY